MNSTLGIIICIVCLAGLFGSTAILSFIHSQVANGELELEQDCKVKVFRVNPEFAGINVADELGKRINLFIKDMDREDYYIEYASLRAALVHYCD